MGQEPTPSMDQIDPDIRLDDDGKPFVDPPPQEPGDVPADVVAAQG
jgi:hypothetical protein